MDKESTPRVMETPGKFLLFFWGGGGQQNPKQGTQPPGLGGPSSRAAVHVKMPAAQGVETHQCRQEAASQAENPSRVILKSCWYTGLPLRTKAGLWGMTTSVIQQKGPNPKDSFLHIKGDSLVSQKWLD